MRIKLAPGILDKFQYYQKSEQTWEQYWGSSDNPSKTMEEFCEEQKQDLLNSLNGAQIKPNEAMERGAAFDVLIGNMIKGLVPIQDTFPYSIWRGGKEYLFGFDYTNKIFHSVEYSRTQVWVEKEYDLGGGDVAFVRGKIDNLFLDELIDLKTTKTYKAFQYRDGMQHRFYMDAVREYDLMINRFTYLVTDFKQVYEEFYTWEDSYPGEIESACSELFQFIKDNMDQITNPKRFY